MRWLLAILLLCLVSPSQTSPPKRIDDKKDPAKQNDRDKSKLPEKTNAPASDPVSSQDQRKPDDQPNRGSVADWVGIVVTAAGLGIMYYTLRATRQAAEAALLNARHLQNAERGWIVPKIQISNVKGFEDGNSLEDIAGGVVEMGVAIRGDNEGRTPATLLKWSIRAIITTKVPNSPDWDALQYQTASDIVPPGEGKWSAWFTIKATGDLKPTDAVVLIYGRIEYTDVFRMSRSATYGYTLRGSNVTRLHQPEYNAHS